MESQFTDAMQELVQEFPWTKGNHILGYNHLEKKVWILKQRLHHGAVGIAVASIGVLLVLHDRKDWREWFKAGL